MKAGLISDIHGSQGTSSAYMTVWQHILQQRGYEVMPCFLDSLCPAAYQTTPFDKETTHHHFVHNGGIEAATLALRALLVCNPVDLLLGFSLGGFLACQVRDTLPAEASIVCISATRLRLLGHTLPGDCPIHMVFGQDDPFRPERAPALGGTCHDYLIAQAGHEVYLTPERCSFVLDALPSARYRAPADD
jgi:hypothetical protein